MVNCKQHSILVHDACGNFKETLTFNKIFSLKCVDAALGVPSHKGYKYASLEGQIFDTSKYLVVPHKDSSGNNYSDPSGNIIYHATKLSSSSTSPTPYRSRVSAKVGNCHWKADILFIHGLLK